MPEDATAWTEPPARVARADADLAKGDEVGEYVVEGRLGAGGMGTVYAVVHPVIGKRAAVKVLSAHMSRDQDAVARFVQEARAVNQIGHPNIVDIFGFGALADGRSYFVMERLLGESLRARVVRGRLGVGAASRILDSVALALEAAHAAGIVHRDLKPDNVFLVRAAGVAQQVKLLDFGIAKLLARDERTSPVTQAGSLLGTPAYLSPEQAQGRDIDHRTDIYSLGAMAYELYTGALPFPAEMPVQMILAHVDTPPPSVRVKVPSVPAAIDELIQRMMAKAMSARPTLLDVRDVLGAYAAPEEPPMRPSSPPAVGMPLPDTLLHTPPAGLAVPPARVASAVRLLGPSEPTLTPTIASAAVRRPRGPIVAVTLAIGAVLGVGAAVFTATRTPSDERAASPQPLPPAASPRPPAASPQPLPPAASPQPLPPAASPQPLPPAASPQPLPPAASPQPPAASPQPSAASPQPSAASPQPPAAASPQPPAASPPAASPQPQPSASAPPAPAPRPLAPASPPHRTHGKRSPPAPAAPVDLDSPR